jgi:predicted ATPase
MLDEPDVYMHPDLQRRLIRFLRARFPQTIITTHAVEMLAEVDPKEILVIDRKRENSDFADTLPAMQRAIDGLGAIHNIQLSRLGVPESFCSWKAMICNCCVASMT